ncbi:hypothetical protein J7T55_012126 [Diaporthe amygdali]|uniref:uncharacterized protein n=1 Tax=Phomopsis amygdali TaxID=1214568 RepID=UPI0022FE2B64|nr:uncharacterized protein J7T55_012126 [Diaporthe amygdali]KAJ0123660.1 hypothetical protein J7T55_012126 [Diaporthe amygdali]
MSKVGILPVPAGEVADFDGFSELQVRILVVYIVTSALATIGLILRFYTGACLNQRRLGLDAFLILAAWAVYLASFIGMLKVFPCGFGKHLWSVTQEQLQCYMNELLFLGVTYFWPPTLAKLSLIVLYHRLNPNTGFRAALYAIAFVVTTYTIVFTAVLSGPCNPLNVGSSTCLNNVALAQAVLNISTDGVLVIMPVIMLWGLNMPRKQKVAVGCILTLGSGAVIASCVRIAYVRAMINNPDVLYTQGSAAVWSAVEINIGILCNCLAMLKPFVRRHLPWLVSLVGSGADGSSASEGAKAKDSGVRCSRFRRSGAKSGGSGAAGAVGAGAGNYQLHSFGRDKEACKFGEGDGRSTTVTSRSDILKTPDELSAQKGGILVTTSTHLTMGRASDGDISSEGILTGSDEEGMSQYETCRRKQGQGPGKLV